MVSTETRGGIFGIFRRWHRGIGLFNSPQRRAKLERWTTSTETKPLRLSPEHERARKELREYRNKGL